MRRGAQRGERCGTSAHEPRTLKIASVSHRPRPAVDGRRNSDRPARVRHSRIGQGRPKRGCCLSWGSAIGRFRGLRPRMTSSAGDLREPFLDLTHAGRWILASMSRLIGGGNGPDRLGVWPDIASQAGTSRTAASTVSDMGLRVCRRRSCESVRVGVGDHGVTPYGACPRSWWGALHPICPSWLPMPAWPAVVLIRSLSTRCGCDPSQS
jgi:hypothetical protein